jgi:outer membrane protein
MTTFRPFFLTLLSLAAFSSGAWGQARSIDLDQAVQLAVRNNRQLQISRLEMDKSDYRVREAIGNALPNISASGSYARALLKSVFFLPEEFITGKMSGGLSGRVVPVEIGADNSFQFGLQATQVLFNQIVLTGVGASRIYQQASREMYRSAYNATVAGATRAFNTVLFARSMHDVVRRSLLNAEENLRTIQILNGQGLVADYDLIRAQVQVDNARPGAIEAERNVVMATNALKLQMGMSPNDEIEVVGELVFTPMDSVLLASAEEQLATHNATLKALELSAEVNDAMISLYRAESYPMLTAFGNYAWQAQNNDLGRLSLSEFVRSSQVGLNLSFNLFNGLQSRNRVNQAQVDLMKAQEQFRAAKDGLLVQLQNIRLRLQESRRRIESQTRTVAQAEKGYGIAQTRYGAGAGTLLEINDADLALQRARANRLQAIYDYSNARADLEELLSAAEPSN